MNKEVEQAMEKLKDHYLQIYNGKIELVDKELFDIIKQAFSDMEEERKQRDETEQSLSKWIVELQAKLDEIKEIVSYELEDSMKTSAITRTELLKELEKILKEE